jgi:hypothetical protein
MNSWRTYSNQVYQIIYSPANFNVVSYPFKAVTYANHNLMIAKQGNLLTLATLSSCAQGNWVCLPRDIDDGSGGQSYSFKVIPLRN